MTASSVVIGRAGSSAAIPGKGADTRSPEKKGATRRIDGGSIDRKRILPGQRIALQLTARDCELLLEETDVDPEHTQRLRPEPGGSGFAGEFTVDDLEDMLGYIASHANHTEISGLRLQGE